MGVILQVIKCISFTSNNHIINLKVHFFIVTEQPRLEGTSTHHLVQAVVGKED